MKEFEPNTIYRVKETFMLTFDSGFEKGVEKTGKEWTEILVYDVGANAFDQMFEIV